MEDILSDVLSLCSVETLAYIWVTDDKILGIHFRVLRYILRKNTNCSISQLFDSLNRRDICTDRVSDSYRLLHYKKYFLLEKFIKKCTRNGLYSFVMKWCEDNEINLCDYDFFGKTEYITEITNYSVSVAFEYFLRHDFSIDSFPLDLVNPRNLIAVAIRYNKWEIIPEDLVYRDSILSMALLLKNYDFYVDPEKYIPEKYRHLFTINRAEEVRRFKIYSIQQS
jgi:hypothetical protein